MNKAIFLDRDGTLIEEVPYLKDPSKVKLKDEVCSGLRRLQSYGFKLIIISNQSGIDRKIFTDAELIQVTNKLLYMLYEQHITIDDVYYCPHHPDEKCLCRKPDIELFERAIKDHTIIAKKSYMIGDNFTDTDAGKRIKTKTILLLDHPKKLFEIPESYSYIPDYIAYGFKDATNWILK